MCYSYMKYTHIFVVPGPPENFNVQVLNHTTVQLSWQPPTTPNGIILFYTIAYNGTRLTLAVSYCSAIYNTCIMLLLL